MFILGQYDEFSPGMGFPSIHGFLQQKPVPNKEIILEYLYKGNVHMVTASFFTDFFTGKQVKRELVFMNDEKYSWSSKVPYYVDKYNLQLPEYFVTHVLQKTKVD